MCIRDRAHRILQVLADIRREGKVMTYLRPDAKSQVTIEYDDNGTPVRIDTIVVSTQHDDFIQPEDDSQAAQLKADEEMLSIIRRDVIEILMPRVIASKMCIRDSNKAGHLLETLPHSYNETGRGELGIHPRTIPPKECMERNTGSHCCRFRIDGNRLLGGDVRAGIASGHHA